MSIETHQGTDDNVIHQGDVKEDCAVWDGSDAPKPRTPKPAPAKAAKSKK